MAQADVEWSSRSHPNTGRRVTRSSKGYDPRGVGFWLYCADPDSEAARGPDPQDVRRIRPAAEAGFRQASAVMAEVRTFWTDPGVDASRTASHLRPNSGSEELDDAATSVISRVGLYGLLVKPMPCRKWPSA